MNLERDEIPIANENRFHTQGPKVPTALKLLVRLSFLKSCWIQMIVYVCINNDNIEWWFIPQKIC